MVGLVHRHEADIALGPHDLTEIRSTAIDYTAPIFSDARKFVVGQSRTEVDPFGFTLPLAPLVWVGILIALLVIAMTAVVLQVNYRRVPRHSFAHDVFFHTYRLLIQQGIEMRLEAISERIITCGWMFGSMILYWSYCSNLMSILAIRYAPQPIQTIQDLLENHKMSVIFPPGTALTDYIENVESGQLRDLVRLRDVGRYKDFRSRNQ
ncbi:hypothetical protein SK128_025406 [Halocaridina rubra]|uniref:Ionotropic glutamate receptor C-terminal domain-containing protein n=1 Tax=Halocaridina rubra TaxID=373956 RepID=A0AAN8XGM6_HALRR